MPYYNNYNNNAQQQGMRLKAGEELVSMGVLPPAAAAAVAAQRAALERAGDAAADGGDDDDSAAGAVADDDDGAAADASSPEAVGPWLVLVTAKGMGKRVALARLAARARGAMGVTGIRLGAGDKVALAAIVRGASDEVLIASRGGQMARFAAADIRCPIGTRSKGVRLVALKPGDEVQAATVLPGGDGEGGEAA